MQLCEFPTAAIRIEQNTLPMITALNGGATPEIASTTTYFMIYCFGSDHEEREIVDEETYARTYEPMPDHIVGMFVRTID